MPDDFDDLFSSPQVVDAWRQVSDIIVAGSKHSGKLAGGAVEVELLPASALYGNV